jgi:hypothetical protein
MASRKEEKQRLREERLAQERTEQHDARRKWIYGPAVAVVLGAAVVGAIVLIASSGGGSGGGSDGAAFGTHLPGLEARRAKASVTTMSTPNSETHIHPHLAVYVDGKQVKVPANIGLDPSQIAGGMTGLHTHDAKGTIHDEGMANSHLGQFFTIWGVAFSPTQLGPYRASGSKVVRMWVDGKPSKKFGDLLLADGQRIVLAYGDRKVSPPPLGQ